MAISQDLTHDSDALTLVIQLRLALHLAATELHRRCVISSQINDALSAADLFIGYHQAAHRAEHHDSAS